MLKFEIIELDYNYKDNELIIKASSKISSIKTFPIYTIDNQEMLFKPLSYTKPLTTPFFAYAEVFWSNIFCKYFDANVPLYTLAYCHHLSECIPKYYSKGTLVPLQKYKDCKIMNLYDYFILYPDDYVDIKDYINYCGTTYDYTTILQAKVFKNNKRIAKRLAFYILFSILKLDYNFHYENILLYVKDDKIIDLVPMLDHEFSLYFLYPDSQEYTNHFLSYYSDISRGTCYKNITYIQYHYPDIYSLFIENIKVLKKNVKNNHIIFNKEFIGDFSTDSWLIGNARYKQHNEEKARQYENSIQFIDASNYDFEQWNDRLESSLNIIINLFLKDIEKQSNCLKI